MTLDHHTTRAAGLGARHPPAPVTVRGESSGHAGEGVVTAWRPSLAHMSHELRTPIHVVLSYAALLREGAGGALPQSAAEMVGRIARSAQHLRKLVDDLLDLARLDEGHVQLVLEEISLDELLRDAITSLEPQARSKGLALELRGAGIPRVRTDATRVWQIVLNLLSNAIKFTERGVVTVVVESNESRVAVHVVDTGPGIEAQDVTRVFDEFVQVGRARGGTGLGLAISRRLAHLLGGEITLQSEHGRGSCFTLTLPVHGPAQAPGFTIALPAPLVSADDRALLRDPCKESR